MGSNTYTTAGNFTWTVPSNAFSVTVEIWGAGGGGAGSNAARGSAGGGGGAFAQLTNYAVTPGAQHNLTIGNGGAGGGANANGTAGNNTVFRHSNNANAAWAERGMGGARASATNAAGGRTANSSGNITQNGGNSAGRGAASTYYPGSGGGAGGSTGAGSSGSNGLNAAGGAGGTGNNAGGNGGNAGVTGNLVGQNGVQPGGGGGGGKNANSAGGRGGVGKIVITWTDTWAVDVHDSITVAEYENHEVPALAFYDLDVHDSINASEVNTGFPPLYFVDSYDKFTVSEYTEREKIEGPLSVNAYDKLGVAEYQDKLVTTYYLSLYDPFSVAEYTNRFPSSYNLNVYDKLDISEYSNQQAIYIQYRLPTGQLSTAWIPSSDGQAYECVDDPLGSPDEDAFYIYVSGSYTTQTFTYSPFEITSVSIEKVSVTARLRKESANSSRVRLIVSVNGSLYANTEFDLTTNYEYYTWDLFTNPETGLPWTEADVEGTGANPLQRFGVASFSETEVRRCTQVYCSVTYTTKIAYDTYEYNSVATNNSLSWTHTASGSNRLLFVMVTAYSETYALSDVTYDGVSIQNNLVFFNDSFYNTVRCYYVLAPSTSAKTIQVTYTGNMVHIFGASISYTGVSQVLPFGDFENTDEDNIFGTTISPTVNAEADELVVGYSHNNTNGTWTPDGNQVERFQESINDAHLSWCDKEGEVGSRSLTWTLDSGRWMWAGAVPLIPASRIRINVSDNFTVQEYKEVLVFEAFYSVNVSDNLTVQEYQDKKLTTYYLNVYDLVSIQEFVDKLLPFYNASVSDSFSLQELGYWGTSLYDVSGEDLSSISEFIGLTHVFNIDEY